MALNGISGKVALVTGAARRRSIGRATALRLAREGADVACLDIARPYADFPGHGVASADELEELVAEIRGAGTTVALAACRRLQLGAGPCRRRRDGRRRSAASISA